MNSSVTLHCEVIPPYDDTSPPIISWLRHHRDSRTVDESKFGTKGFDENGFRLIDEYKNPKFDVLQKCAINGICDGHVLEVPLEYTLQNITTKEEGWYSCLAKNNFGVNSPSNEMAVVRTPYLTTITKRDGADG